MAKLDLLWTAEPVTSTEEMAAFLAPHGIDYARWEMPERASALGAQAALTDQEKAELLSLFGAHLEQAAAEGGYVDADVVAVRNVPGIDEALAKFDKVHFHDDDEVRAIVGGCGVFGFIGDDGRQFLLHVEAGDYISVPAGMWHWFYCDGDRNITALRLFKDRSGWVPHYRETARGVPGSNAPAA